MKVFFVGIHNKPGMEPLDITTASGKMVTAVASLIDYPIERTNLCDIEHMPDAHNAAMWAREWHRRHPTEKGDIIVLLGAFVHSHFITQGIEAKVIKLPHPASSLHGNIKKGEWIDSAVRKIKASLSLSPNTTILKAI